MVPTSRRHLIPVGIVVFVLVVFVVWQTRLLNSELPPQIDPVVHASDARQQADAGADSGEAADITAGPTTLTTAALEAEDSDELIPLDVPEEPLELRQQFGAQLLQAAEMNGKGTAEEACLEWGRLLALALEDEASDDERTVALLNVTDACARNDGTPRTPHELRLAYEALARRVEDDPQLRKELEHFLTKHPEFVDTRSAFLVVNEHGTDTVVTLDGMRICTEPCTLAIPIDGKPHHMGFAGPGGEASLVWSPSTPDAAPPAIPELKAN